MIIKSATFICSSADFKQCPNSTFFEFAFIGRSNVGKSTLINYLTNKKKLAKTSSSPGKTQLINHFCINDTWYLVDLPGYGYAKTSKKNREQLKHIIVDYLVNRKNLKLTFVLLDSRRELQKIDLEFINWMGINKLPFYIILTKIDKISKAELNQNIISIKEKILEHWSKLPPIFICSSSKKIGRKEILASIKKTLESL